MFCKNMCLAAVTSDSQYLGIYLNDDCQKSAVSCQSAPEKSWDYCSPTAYAPVSTLVAHPPLKEPGGDKELSVLGLRILLTHAHFPSGRLKIRCIGSLAHLYWQSTENSVEVDRPRGAAAAALQTDKPPPGHLDMDLPGEAQTMSSRHGPTR
uniref:Uncharacterized protein n=1 Tax=Timema poppense TaxID=170557 RepID=A0A7R9DUJ9_TIMPO|nr:unnamed protein product [Timema poppensis]